MRVLLSEGNGLTARQTATLLARAGHHVEALSPEPLCLCRFTRHVRAVHRVPAYGTDPFGWLDAALDVAARTRTDLLFPTQEQVAVLAAVPERLRAAGLRTVVPEFTALARVQDKRSAYATLEGLGVPQPPTEIAETAKDLERVPPPVYVKSPIGTASVGVVRARTAEDLRNLAARYDRAGVFASGGGVLAQRPVDGPLVMVQSVFAYGEPVAFHACERTRAGVNGGASHKRGLRLPEAEAHVRRLGAALGWHGALSADVINGPEGLSFIDVNPRLVEPVNAYLSGVDLVGAMVDIARTGTAAVREPRRAGVRTHQFLLALFEAARRGGRVAAAREAWRAGTGRADYRGGTEELQPARGDLPAAAFQAALVLAVLAYPGVWRRLAGDTVGAYALTPDGWRHITTYAAG